MEILQIKKLRPSAKLPERATDGSVGYDIAACLDGEVLVMPGETRPIETGFSMALDPGYAAFIYARSGLAVRSGIVPANCVGVIDPDYRGEVVVGLRNMSREPFRVRGGDRIAQMVIAKCELPEPVECDELGGTARGAGGFGSTGR